MGLARKYAAPAELGKRVAGTMNYIPLVRAGALQPFLDFLAQAGTPVERLLFAAKVPRKALENPHALISLHDGTRFLDLAARREGAETLGLEAGLGYSLERMGAFGALVRSSLTLFEALETARGMIAAYNSGLRIWTELEGGEARIFHRNLTPPGLGRKHVDLHGMTLVLSLVRLAAGPGWQPGTAGFQMPCCRALAGPGPFAGARLLFDQPASFIALPAGLLARPLRPPLDGGLRGEWAGQLRASAPALDLAGSLRQALRARLGNGGADIHRAAASAGMSARSLQRRLAAEGAQYCRLVEEVRYEEALRLMDDPAAKLKDVAVELGYRDCANFTRAFRRWTGEAPSEFRRRRLEP